jgi:galactosamine-6-phosphate isomerase
MKDLAFVSFADYRALSEAACARLLALVRRKPDAVICLATGATPLLTYQLFVQAVKAQRLDVSLLTFVKLDEWVGLPADAAGTCEAFLQEHILQPLDITDAQYIAFNGETADESECARIVEKIAHRGGLDLCLLGLGKNGHLGLNEPAAFLQPSCHIARLDSQTRQHDMIKHAGLPVEHGITLGLRDLLAAKEVLFLVAGDGKQRAFSAFCEGKVTTELPASLLWLHPDTTCLYDSSLYAC